MGWKCSCVIATELEDACLASGPQHDPVQADRIAAAIGGYLRDGASTFEEGCYPSDGRLYIGAYQQSLIIGDLDVSSGFMEPTRPEALAIIEAIMPNARVLAIELQSVVNWYGYAYYDAGELVRLRVGGADDGVLHDIGEPLPEERPLLEKAYVNDDGEQVWAYEYDDGVDEMDHASMGEEFVFEVARSMFGERFDVFDHDRLEMSVYRPERRAPWRWFLGR